MLKNIPISELIKVLTSLQKEGTLCTIDINEAKQVITFYVVKDPMAIVNNTKIEIPKPDNQKLDIDDIERLIV